jgi:nicotinate-nucleotide pyrophosphorylase
MAITLCPAGRLKNFALDNTNAGLLLAAAESVKGKGTTTISKRSKFTIGLVIGSGIPFAQRPFHRLSERYVAEARTSEANQTIFDLEGKYVPLLDAERGTYRQRYRRLEF